MRTDDELAGDWQFIYDEVVRYSRMSIDEIKSVWAEIGFNEFRDADGTMRIAGQRAMERMRLLARDALESSPFGGRVEFQRAYTEVRDGFGRTYLRVGERADPTGSEFREQLSAWIAAAGQDCGARTHFIPCNIGLRGVEAVTLGPVTISSRAAAWPHLEELTNGLLAKAADEQERQHCEFGINAAKEYYSAFLDIAEITVPACDGPTSRRVADAALQAVLDFLHVLAGAGHTERMRHGGPAIRDKRGEINVEPDGRTNIVVSSRGGGAFIGENWWMDFTSPDRAHYRDAVGKALIHMVEGREPGFMATRFFDACAWFGDAAREPSHAAAIVKYLTAMERLLWAGETGQGVTRRLAGRAAALCFSTLEWNMEELEDEIEVAYETRSKIVHGRISKSDPEVLRQLRLCERVSRDLLLTWLDRYWELFETPIAVEQIAELLDKFTKAARAECRAQRAAMKRPKPQKSATPSAGQP